MNKEKYLNGEFDKFKNTSSTTTSIENKTLKLLDIIKRVSINQENYNINKDTHLFNNGIIDSFGFIDLISEVEIEFETKVPEVLQDYDYFSTINNIINTLNDINSGKAYTNKINIDENHEMSMSNLDFNNDIKSQIYQTNSKTEERSKDSHYNRFKNFL